MGAMLTALGGGCYSPSVNLDRTVPTVTLGDNTWGSWQTIISSLPAQCYEINLDLHSPVGLDHQYQVGIGATPTVIVDGIRWEARGETGITSRFDIPLSLGAGSQLSVRGQYTGTTGTRTVLAEMHPRFGGLSGLNGFGAMDLIGRQVLTCTVDNSNGPRVSYGTLTRSYRAFVLRGDINTQGASVVNNRYRIDISASTTEIVTAVNIFTGATNKNFNPASCYRIPRALREGMDLQARVTASTANLSMGCTIWGLR